MLQIAASIIFLWFKVIIMFSECVTENLWRVQCVCVCVLSVHFAQPISVNLCGCVCESRGVEGVLTVNEEVHTHTCSHVSGKFLMKIKQLY